MKVGQNKKIKKKFYPLKMSGMIKKEIKEQEDE